MARQDKVPLLDGLFTKLNKSKTWKEKKKPELPAYIKH